MKINAKAQRGRRDAGKNAKTRGIRKGAEETQGRKEGAMFSV